MTSTASGIPSEPIFPGDVPAASEGRCNACEWGWERYVNPNGIWLHRNATDTLGAMCTAPPAALDRQDWKLAKDGVTEAGKTGADLAALDRHTQEVKENR